MTSIPVNVKHSGKTHALTLEVDAPGLVFKEAVWHVTGVPVDRMKIMVKGGVLKDDADWKKLAPKANQTFMVIGAAGELPKAPTKPVVFLEDMDDGELAEALAKPVGLTNLGNTCYMNATIQALRAIPELQVALRLPTTTQGSPLPPALASLYNNMAKTTSTLTPTSFLQILRQVNPQFAEMSRAKGFGAGYAQQDADECYGQIVNSFRDVPGLASGSTSASATSQSVASAGPGGNNFVDQWMMANIQRELKCDEAPEEAPTVRTESILKVECNISMATNYMMTGIMNSLDQKLTKNSPTLGRDAIYTQHSRITRLPAYLTVHMVRFAWRADIGKKAKILRKVKFPVEFDALDLVTDELKAKLLPASRKLKDIERERAERRKVRGRNKGITTAASTSAAAAASTSASADVEMGDATAANAITADAILPEGETKLEAGELAPESEYRTKENAEVEALIDPTVRADVGASISGLYDLVAIITHKGPAADAGHYMGFVKKSVFHANKSLADPTTEDGSAVKPFEIDESDEDWYKFDDDKVSVFPVDKLNTLDGGGEDSSAYLLLYKTRSIV